MTPEEMFYGTLPQDTQSFDRVLQGIGRNVREFGRAAQYVPYDILGAPVDLATLAMRPFGYRTENPVGGSDWLINLARQMGVADKPTNSGTELAGRVAFGAISPVAATRGLTKVGRFVDMLKETPPAIQNIESKTNAFENWFKGSKLVDESGNPMVVYHGSGSKDIQEFDVSKYETVQRGDWGEGIYFTPSKWIADSYRKTAVQRGDKSIQKAFDSIETKAKEFNTSGMNKWLDLRSGKITQSQYDELNELENVWRKKLKEAESSDKGAVYPVYLNLKNPYVYTYGGITEPDLAKLAKKQGHDGIIVKNESGNIEEIVVFNPKQIKSASKNAGTFDPNTANIYRGAFATPFSGLLGQEEE